MLKVFSKHQIHCMCRCAWKHRDKPLSYCSRNGMQSSAVGRYAGIPQSISATIAAPNCKSTNILRCYSNEFTIADEERIPLETRTKQALSLTRTINKDYLNIDEVVEMLKEDMGQDLCVIKLDPNRLKFHYVDYFIVVSARSVRHMKSMAFGLCMQFKKRVRELRGKPTAVIEGEDSVDWMVVDIGNIVVHFMMPETRDIYELEKLWTLGPTFDDQYKAMVESEDVPIAYAFKSKNYGMKETIHKE